VTIAATGGKDRTVRLWGLAPLVPSPVQKPQIATLRGHGAPVTCLAITGGSSCWGSSWGSSWDGGGWDGGSTSTAGSSSASSGWLLSGSLDGRVKSWDPWTAACTGTVKCGAPVAAMQPVAGCPELQPHGLLVAGGCGVQLLDLRCMRAVAAAAALPAERAEQVHCFAQHGWDLAVGSSDGARVYNFRMLSSSPSAATPSASAAAGSGGGAGGKGPPERLRLGGHALPVSGARATAACCCCNCCWLACPCAAQHNRDRCVILCLVSSLAPRFLPSLPLQVTSIHVDRHKVVTATSRYGQAPVRVWCPHSGDCLAELDSCLPAPSAVGGASGSSSGEAAGSGEGGGEEQPMQAAPGLDPATAAAGAAAGVDAGQPGQGGAEEEPQAGTGSSGQRPHHQQYHRGWEGVTALACRGALLVTGSSEGAVCERDYGRGGLPEAEQEGDAAGLLAGKFWQYSLGD
jgi:hypothetical protein